MMRWPQPNRLLLSGAAGALPAKLQPSKALEAVKRRFANRIFIAFGVGFMSIIGSTGLALYGRYGAPAPVPRTIDDVEIVSPQAFEWPTRFPPERVLSAIKDDTAAVKFRGVLAVPTADRAYYLAQLVAALPEPPPAIGSVSLDRRALVEEMVKRETELSPSIATERIAFLELTTLGEARSQRAKAYIASQEAWARHGAPAWAKSLGALLTSIGAASTTLGLALAMRLGWLVSRMRRQAAIVVSRGGDRARPSGQTARSSRRSVKEDLWWRTHDGHKIARESEAIRAGMRPRSTAWIQSPTPGDDLNNATMNAVLLHSIMGRAQTGPPHECRRDETQELVGAAVDLSAWEAAQPPAYEGSNATQGGDATSADRSGNSPSSGGGD